MAGDWIKVRHDLPADPAVIGIAARLELPEDEVVGKLLRFWIWGDQQTKDGNAPGVTKTFLDRYLGVTGFAQAMQDVGWLDVGNGGISIPNFERHISESAKRRALTARRKAKCQAKKGNAASVTKAFPREEKRRVSSTDVEDKYDPLTATLPFSSDAFSQAWADFCRHRKEIVKVPLTELAVARLMKKCSEWGEAEAIASIDATIESGKWTGLFPQKGTHGKPSTAFKNRSGRPDVKSIKA